MMTQASEYEDQIQQYTKQINKWKDKYKMLTNYKKEEELNFKRKFDQLNTVEENRFKIKETIIGVKNN